MPITTDSYATLLEIDLCDPLPPCFALAHKNTCILQQHSNYMSAIVCIKDQATEETKNPHKLRTRKISFQEDEVKVFVYRGDKKVTDVKLYDKIPLRRGPKVGIRSSSFIRKYIWTCLVSTIPWNRMLAGHPEMLSHLLTPPITIEVLRGDLRKIYTSFRQFRPVILNYKHSFKLPYQYSQRRFDPIKQQWFYTCENIQIATKLRLYLIKIIKDRELAAISLQAAWRRKSVYIKHFNK